MKIGYICSEYPALCEHHGGIGSMTQTHARYFAKHGHQVTIYGLGSGDKIINNGNINIRAFSKQGIIKSTLAVRKQIRSDLRTGKIDVIESPECEAHLLPLTKKSIVRLHGSHHFWCKTLFQPKKPLRLILEQLGVRQAQGLCSVSAFAAEITRSAMHLGQRPIETLYNPVDTDLFSPGTQKIVHGRIVFVGSITGKKGIRQLCIAMNTVLKQFPEAQLHIAGHDIPRSTKNPTCKEQILQNLDSQTKKHLTFLGHLSPEKVRDLLSTASLCVFPSYMETQGIAICEAMACGRPVIAGCHGPGSEILGQDGECGFLVDPRDPSDIAAKISRVLSDAALAEKMGKQGRNRVLAKFSASVCCAKSLSFYTRFTDRK